MVWLQMLFIRSLNSPCAGYKEWVSLRTCEVKAMVTGLKSGASALLTAGRCSLAQANALSLQKAGQCFKALIGKLRSPLTRHLLNNPLIENGFTAIFAICK
ncbi:hypothetical protein E6C76_01345 [Pseudothauera nasutitermitis]|uniref:Uncharacterized protein n=1 Tax=Pseudothauera nasutitermitis TaxID=2565930 RepID=A0A4S4B363_9RHOO|nr:hypothetical protein [Pseudothauera nasutitermitis]THF67062.1 hypothetical protein E6C76_01345 [Pseudothauera nasutitermitis]